jgi:DNA polymerase-3 subunit epsilon
LRGNRLVAIDVETTGLDPNEHEIIEIAVVALDSNIEPDPAHRPFFAQMKPQKLSGVDPRALMVHGRSLASLILTASDPDVIYDAFADWVSDLELPTARKLIPLCHNWAFDRPFLLNWLGQDTFHQLIKSNFARDTLTIALAINDHHSFFGRESPYFSVSLETLCSSFGIEHTTPHNALSDALACAKVYQYFLKMCFR